MSMRLKQIVKIMKYNMKRSLDWWLEMPNHGIFGDIAFVIMVPMAALTIAGGIIIICIGMAITKIKNKNQKKQKT